MSVRWSSESVVAEHRDLQASAMAVDWTGQYALLAGRRCLAVVNLDEPSETLKKITRQSKYEVGAAEWNPTSANGHLCAVSINQRTEILRWQSGDLISNQTLRCHTRVISDLNWNQFSPNILASCSIDTFIYIWDIRDTRRPSISLSAIAGASQVRWNKVTENLLATAHDEYVKLWDQRKGTAPVQYIAAHLSKIHGLDWSPRHEHQLATSSQDSTVKFFDVRNPRRAESILSTVCPVWRARYTPFGEGLVTVVVPLLRRGENSNSLTMWNITNLTSPVHTFVGHNDAILAFEWRCHAEDPNEYEMVTWSKDQSLRIWRIEPHILKMCGHDPEAESVETTDSEVVTVAGDTPEVANGNTAKSPPVLGANTPPPSDRGTPVSTPAAANSDTPPLLNQPKTLQQEFTLTNINIPNVQVDEMDAVARSCRVTAKSNKHRMALLVNFPPAYPNNAIPTFQIADGTTVDSNTKVRVLKVLKQTSQQHVKKNLSCLEPCIRQLVATLEQVANEVEEHEPIGPFPTQPQPPPYVQPSNTYGSFQDANIPFPRTSGARFCSAGIMVCFGRPSHLKRMSSRTELATPRSLSALGAYLNSFALGGAAPTGTPSQYNLMYPPMTQSPTAESNVSISTFYYQDRKMKIRKGRRPHSIDRGEVKPPKAGMVYVYDTTALLPLHRELAEKYVIDSTDIPNMCMKNAACAAAVGRQDLVQLWSVASCLATGCGMEEDMMWYSHPYASALLTTMIERYIKAMDVQTVAMLCCAFGTKNECNNLEKKKANKCDMSSTSGSPYHTVHQMDSTFGSMNLPNLKQNRSNSWSDSLDDFRLISANLESKGYSVPVEAPRPKEPRMLNAKFTQLYDEYKKAYAEILYRWNLLNARSLVLKYCSSRPEQHRGVEFVTECQYCQKPSRGAQCFYCKRLSFQCVICHISVRGSSSFCLVCGHGGHSHHMMGWFEKYSFCPTGCGCNCVEESAHVFES